MQAKSTQPKRSLKPRILNPHQILRNTIREHIKAQHHARKIQATCKRHASNRHEVQTHGILQHELQANTIDDHQLKSRNTQTIYRQHASETTATDSKCKHIKSKPNQQQPHTLDDHQSKPRNTQANHKHHAGNTTITARTFTR